MGHIRSISFFSLYFLHLLLPSSLICCFLLSLRPSFLSFISSAFLSSLCSFFHRFIPCILLSVLLYFLIPSPPPLISSFLTSFRLLIRHSFNPSSLRYCISCFPLSFPFSFLPSFLPYSSFPSHPLFPFFHYSFNFLFSSSHLSLHPSFFALSSPLSPLPPFIPLFLLSCLPSSLLL